MSYAFSSLYTRLIKRKAYDEATITLMVDDAYDKKRLTTDEYNQLVNLIGEVYG